MVSRICVYIYAETTVRSFVEMQHAWTAEAGPLLSYFNMACTGDTYCNTMVVAKETLVCV